MSIRSKSEVARTVAEVVTDIAAAGATGDPVALAAAGAKPAVARLLALAVERWGRAGHRKYEAWLNEVAATWQHGSAEETARLIEENIDQPWAEGPLRDAVRAIRDDIDVAALPYLARLAAWQLRDKVPPDRWSRRAVALLLDCDAAIIEALGHLTSHLAERWPPRITGYARVAIGGPNIDSHENVTLSAPNGRMLGEGGGPARWEPHRLYPEVFNLLRRHQFATEESGEFAYEGKMLIRRLDAAYLVRLVRGPDAARALAT